LPDLDSLIKQSLENATSHTKKVYGQSPLTGQELVDLANSRALTLAATVKPDQRPHLSPVDLNILDDKIYIGIDQGTARHKNLKHNHNITIMMADGRKMQAIVEGETRMLDMKSDTAGRVLEAQKKKYGWTTQLLAEVLPKKIFTYKSQPRES
jgi:putative heme iron utilization protein